MFMEEIKYESEAKTSSDDIAGYVRQLSVVCGHNGVTAGVFRGAAVARVAALSQVIDGPELCRRPALFSG